MTELRRQLIAGLTIRGRSKRTIEVYVRWVAELARFFRRSPDTLGRDELRRFVLALLEQRRLSASSVRQAVGAFPFFYGVTLGWSRERYDVPAPQEQQALPEILSRQEVDRIFAATANSKYRLMLMRTYAAGLRLGEVAGLGVDDIPRRTIRIRQGKGQKDRCVPPARTLLPEIQQLPGHRSITTTMRYLHLTHGGLDEQVISPRDAEQPASAPPHPRPRPPAPVSIP